MTAGATVEPARLSEPEGRGRALPPTSPVAVDVAAHGYVQHELFASGTAVAYRGTGPLTADGCWEVAADGEAPYRTRLVLRRPADAGRWSGVVLVEWCNVSGGVEAEPDWAYVHGEVLRAGHAYASVSVQALGVDGGAGLLGVPGVPPRRGLVGSRPERYGTLRHPGDRFAFDLFSQIGAAMRGADGVEALGGTAPQHVIAVGESQSAMFLTTYLDAVHPVARVYDGFLVHSRGGSGASLGGTVLDDAAPAGLRIRDDLDAPVLVFETETDVGPRLDYGPARQPDSDRFRAWEVAGTAHADAYLIGPMAEMLGWEVPVNDGPQHFVVQAALRALVEWTARDTPPPVAEPLVLASASPPVIARDDLGNALGGVRTPDVDVPVAALSGDAAPDADVLRSLFGSTRPFEPELLRRLYGTRTGYLDAYETRLDECIATGFVLAEDRDEMLARAERVPFPG